MNESQPLIKNDQVDKKTTIPTYLEIGKNYGLFTENNASIVFYNYAKFEEAIDSLIYQLGYKYYVAGGQYPPPNFKEKNYTTGWLMIFAPSPNSGGTFYNESETRAWRKIHELAHALTLPSINFFYNEGKRYGSYKNKQLSKEEVLRAVKWEYLAMTVQRILSLYIGITLSYEDYAKELNTNASDAVHRALYGTFVEPEQAGFQPFNYPIPWEQTEKLLIEKMKEIDNE